ncbi:M-phase inducer phosphatase [Sodiomyces alkalinus F11]|uniref:M-phase inducer phosphatase n=1 Tax=Sodiomyces alkalinus (strain CBS 110278 / VKM F-3762 / F11) TaxID=1314773 RepID=A0A3N2PRT4_SODAK|nr:M-phase inducer phosphatase [Sodiomyces alkalinus F11]ROT37198.1 M-phase inducer phosphatase [Sodiomyces alkalinus F11]
MEHSSPLAAMHRPVPVPSWGSRDMFRPHANAHLSAMTGGGGSFRLRERLHKPNPDYFSVNDVRGSSPAASLAADLSQNFRLDCGASPVFPTPRRALFTATIMGDADETRNYVTTPPLPSSSPGQLNETMDISPLPHKVPFFSQVDMASPSPVTSSSEERENDEMMLDSPAPITRHGLLDVPRPLSVMERRKAAPRRPSLTRTKGYSTCGAPGRANTPVSDNQMPAFRFGGFGGESRLSHTSSALSLSECFESNSPPPARPQSANSPSATGPGAFRSRVPSSGMSGMGPRHGLPSNLHSRRPSNPFMRPRKQYRRSLSMFEHPADIMKPKAEETAISAVPELQAAAEIHEVHQLILPHRIADDPSDNIPRITKETLADVLDGKYSEHFDHKMVIDCRFEYEYEGGHIDGAVNYNSKELLSSQLFRHPMEGRTLLVFHCEYSVHRAPLMARHVRSEDRTVNAEHYPKLTYPEVYILEGGYSAFFAQHRLRCYPQSYVEMADEKHQRTCERELGRLKNNGRKGLGRAQTFAFGQRGPCVDQSPTANISRPSLVDMRQEPIAMVGNSPILGERTHTRRMASY